MRYLTALTAAALAAGLSVPALAEGDAAAGEKVYKRGKSCHAVGEGAKNRVGPQLNGIVGAEIASVDGFKYSKAFMDKKAEGLVELAQSSRRYPTFRFEQVRDSGRDVLKIKGVKKAFGDNAVLHGVDLLVQRGERLAIMGPNGIGKSTLLKIVMGELEADEGEVEWGYETHPGYFAQDHREQLDPTHGTAEGWVEPGRAIRAADLLALEKIQGVRVEPGDVILLHTGRWIRRDALGPWPTSEGVAGYHADVAYFMKDRGVSFIGHDMWNDVFPHEFSDEERLPLHRLALVSLGVGIFDNLDFERVAEVAKELNRYEFLFTAAPLRIEMGMGSPINPIATF